MHELLILLLRSNFYVKFSVQMHNFTEDLVTFHTIDHSVVCITDRRRVGYSLGKFAAEWVR